MREAPQDPNWDAAAARVDDLLREITATLDLSRDTLFICSDHGQVDAGGHGGNEQVVLREPFVLLGAGIRPGAYQPVQMVDIAPTLAAILGLNLPASTQGQVRTEMLALTEPQVAAVAAAQAAQQTKLATAYGAALGVKVEAIDSGLVKPTQQAMDAARQEQVNAERLPRFVLAGVLAVLPLGVLIWKRSRSLAWILAGALLYHLVFNLVYALLNGKGYTFSYVIGPTELVIDGLVTALLAFAAGWLLFGLGARIFKRSGREAAEFSFGLALVILYTLALPVLWSYAWDGYYVGRFLPDFSRTFLALLAMVQALAVGLWGLSFAGLAALVAVMRGRKR